MTEAYIYDAVRTPRGRGKKNGSLHEVKPIGLLTTVLNALRKRNQLETKEIDDLVIGCVTPVHRLIAFVPPVSKLPISLQ